MTSTTNKIPLGFTHEQFPAGTHMCLIHDSQDDCDQLIAKFIRAGLENHEKIGYFTDRMTEQKYKEHLLHFFNDDSRFKESFDKQLIVSEAKNTYCPQGEFIPDQMLDSLLRFYEQARSEGFSNCRATGEMTWATQGIPGSDRLIEYEAKLNSLLKQYPVTAICQYDAGRFDGKTIFDILHVHPFMIIRDQVVRNPYFTPPEEFLKNRG